MQRVLRPAGTLYVLEFSRPSFPIRQLYGFYFTRILFGGEGFIKDKAAYTYLPASVLQFPDGKDFEAELEKAGLKPIRSWKQTFGIATIYISENSCNKYRLPALLIFDISTPYMKHLTFTLLLISGSLFAQPQAKVPNLPWFDDKALNFGFLIGFNAMDYKVVSKVRLSRDRVASGMLM